MEEKRGVGELSPLFTYSKLLLQIENHWLTVVLGVAIREKHGVLPSEIQLTSSSKKLDCMKRKLIFQYFISMFRPLPLGVADGCSPMEWAQCLMMNSFCNNLFQ